MQSYTDLDVWQLGMELADEIYRLTGPFPEAEKFGLTSQLRRAAVSTPSNIAESWGRGSTNEYVQFLRYARGSLYEIETQLRISQRNSFLHEDDLRMMLVRTNRLGKMLLGLMRALK